MRWTQYPIPPTDFWERFGMEQTYIFKCKIGPTAVEQIAEVGTDTEELYVHVCGDRPMPVAEFVEDHPGAVFLGPLREME